MNVNVIPTKPFEREAKFLLKKYVSLKAELVALGNQLTLNPYLGDKITENTYKIRIAVKSKGKSGGLRLITFILVKVEEQEEITNVFLLAIYDKSEYEDISNSKIAERIEYVKTILEDSNDSDE
jgi:hypothetical protein